MRHPNDAPEAALLTVILHGSRLDRREHGSVCRARACADSLRCSAGTVRLPPVAGSQQANDRLLRRLFQAGGQPPLDTGRSPFAVPVRDLW
jgi:hypothetical protein